MDDTSLRIARIRDKLPLAKAADAECKVFGAASHRHVLKPPASEDDVCAFETLHDIALPEGFRRFIREVGNGGAGPFYGLHPLGEATTDLTYDKTPGVLARPSLLAPRMAVDDWAVLRTRVGIDADDEAEDARSEATAALYGGVMSLGEQGCGIVHALILNGPFAGRVVNVNDEVAEHPPLFAFEADFLAWYERWLDEVISGELAQSKGWFGYVPGGHPGDLLAGFVSCANERDAADFLDGLAAKPTLHPVIIGTLLRHKPVSAAQRAAICRIVCKSHFARAEPLLKVLASLDPLAFLQCLHWYAGDALAQWQDSILSPLLNIGEEETFRFFTYVLGKLPVDRGAYLAPHARSDNEEIRAQAFHELGKITDKANYVDCFALGLADESPRVVRDTLQALAGVKDPALLPHYRQVAERFPVERDYVLVNLGHRFKEFGLSPTGASPPVPMASAVAPQVPASASPVSSGSLGHRLAGAWRRLIGARLDN